MERGVRDFKREELDNPAIGVIATNDNLDAVARMVIRANNHGHSVLIAHDGDVEIDSLGIGHQQGAWITSPGETPTDDETLHRFLKQSAQIYGFPGLLFNPNPEKLIDYDRINDLAGPDYGGIAPQHESSPKKGSTLVAIPAYNEERTIETVIKEVKSYADEVLVVDDGSDDRTANNAREAGARVIEHETNRGYGAALKTSFEEASRTNSESLIVIDGDGQHDPEDIPTLQAEIDDGADIAIGSRFVDEVETDLPLYRWFGVMVINVLTNLSMGVIRPRSWVHDTQSGFRAYGPQAIETLVTDDEIGDEMNASTDILYHAHAHDYDIREVGTTVDYEVANASSQNPFTHGLNLVRNILRTVERERPITVFGVPGFIAATTGFGIGYWTLSNYLSTGTISLGLMLIAGFCILLGSLASVTAIILHAFSIHSDA